MSDILEQSLDDIIGQKKSNSSSSSNRRFQSRNNRRGSSRSSRHHHPYRSSRRDQDDEDLFSSRSSSRSSSSGIPEKVRLLANNRPTLRIKNIHPDLNGEDLSKLFSNVDDVDFVKFDDDNDTIAYICFQRNCDINNKNSIEKFNGKKAMGNILVVENTVSLFDRINPRSRGPRDRRRDLSPSRRREGPRDGGDRRRGGGDRKGGRHSGRTRPAKKTAEDLDKELNEYMGKTSDSLDAELDDYMKKGNQEEQPEPAANTATTTTTTEGDVMNVD